MKFQFLKVTAFVLLQAIVVHSHEGTADVAEKSIHDVAVRRVKR